MTLEPIAEGAFQPDPYVIMIIPTVDYGAVGSFNVDDNGLINDQGEITGVQHPFRFSVSPECPNNHLIPFRVTITARNGMDTTDETVYSFTSHFSIIVQRGIKVFGEITQDTTWTPDQFYIVIGNTHIPYGVSLTIAPGTKVVFENDAILAVRGNLEAIGNKENRIQFASNSASPQPYSWRGIRIYGSSNVTLSYCDISDAVSTIDQYSSYERLESSKRLIINNCKIYNCFYAIPIFGGYGEILIVSYNHWIKV